MTFALDNDPSQSQISEAINYLLANFGPNLSADPNTGQITGPSGIVIAYLYRYLAVRYADSFDGSLNFSNSPTNRGYYGVNNSNSTTESTNPADYIWFKVAGGFSTTKFLFYQTIGGRAINFVVDTSAPDSSYVQDDGTAIDLDLITAGASANSATTAYLVQSQSDPAPTGFPLYTSGNTLPPGWSATIGTVLVGQVVWYSFGQYNGSSVEVNGIPANSTYWSTPVAASVFQDIRSDNWNGDTPPVFGDAGTYGTEGYYISRETGNVYFNNGVFRADISTDGDAVFKGKTSTTVPVRVNGDDYIIDYSCYAEATSRPILDAMRVGFYGYTRALPNISVNPIAYNVGLLGEGKNFSGAKGYGLIGVGDSVGGYFEGDDYGAILNGTGTIPVGAAVAGKIKWGIYSIPEPAGSTSTYLRNDGTWATITATTATYATYVGNSTDNFTTYNSGSVLGIKSNATTAGLVNSSNNGVFYNGSGTVAFCPTSDNTIALGASSLRWTTVYATTGTINTSDGNQKQDVEELSVAELAVARRIKSLIKKFRFKDAVETKGDAARIHVGAIAQEVRDAFIAEGLDPTRYGIFCSDTDKDGVTTMGLRYEELLAFVIAAI
jgi:hypothetical protein